MFSGGIDPSQQAAFNTAFNNYANFQTTSTQAGLALGAFNSVCSAVSGIWSGVVMSNAQERQYESQGRVADTQMQIQLDYLNTQGQKMEVTVEQTQLRNDWKEKRAEAEGKLQLVEAEKAQQEMTRDATRIDTKRLEQMFSRTDSRSERSRGQPVCPLPSDNTFSESGMYR